MFEYDASDRSARKPAPSGQSTHRKATLDTLRVQSQVEDFDGLPAGISHFKHLIETLRAAAVPLGFPQGAIRLIEKLGSYSSPKDWEGSSRPLVWPSNDTLARSLGLTEAGLTKAIRQVVRLGLVTMKDSPNRQRYGKRDKRGAILVETSYGFDLAPLAVRHAEFKAIADKHLAEIRQRAQACRLITINRAAVAQILEAIDDSGLWTEAWAGMQRRLDTQPIPRRFSGLTLAEARHLADRMAALHTEARGLYDAATQNPSVSVSSELESTGMPVQKSEPKNTTTPNSFQDSVEAWQEGCSGLAGAPMVDLGEGAAATPPSAPKVLTIKPKQLLAACPALQSIVWNLDPTWADLAAACANICGRYGISKETWQEARAKLGILQSIVAFAVVASLPKERFARGPGAYFGGMINRGATGQLNLLGSYFGMVERTARGESRELIPDQRKKDPMQRHMNQLGQLVMNEIERPLARTDAAVPLGRISWQDMIRK